MTHVNSTDARKELFSLIRQTIKRHEPVTIRHREGDVVLMSEEDYEGLLETLELLSIPGFKKSIAEAESDIKAGRVKAMKKIFPDE